MQSHPPDFLASYRLPFSFLMVLLQHHPQITFPELYLVCNENTVRDYLHPFPLLLLYFLEHHSLPIPTSKFQQLNLLYFNFLLSINQFISLLSSLAHQISLLMQVWKRFADLITVTVGGTSLSTYQNISNWAMLKTSIFQPLKPKCNREICSITLPVRYNIGPPRRKTLNALWEEPTAKMKRYRISQEKTRFLNWFPAGSQGNSHL